MIQNFTPISATLGGALIGLSASLLLLSLGRIAGISGIIGGLLDNPLRDAGWRWSFVGGMLAGGLLLHVLWPDAWGSTLAPPPMMLLIGGAIVGFGTRMGSGCTSGHGICGLTRVSPRSMVAVGTIMATGFATASALHVLGLWGV